MMGDAVNHFGAVRFRLSVVVTMWQGAPSRDGVEFAKRGEQEFA